MKSEEAKQGPKSARASDFRYLPADTISVSVSDNAVKIIFGIEEAKGDVVELVGVHMTHRTAVLLRNAISQAIGRLETTTGIKINVPELKLLP